MRSRTDESDRLYGSSNVLAQRRTLQNAMEGYATELNAINAQVKDIQQRGERLPDVRDNCETVILLRSQPYRFCSSHITCDSVATASRIEINQIPICNNHRQRTIFSNGRSGFSGDAIFAISDRVSQSREYGRAQGLSLRVIRDRALRKR